MEDNRKNGLWPWLALIATAVILLVFELASIKQNGVALSSDDGYIFLQYARNFLRFLPFQYNACEFSWAVTSPLWTFLLIPLSWAGATGSKILGIFCFFLAVVYMYRLAGMLFKGRMLPCATALLLPVTGLAIFHALSGMDAILFMLFTIMLIYYYGKANTGWITALFFLAPLVRPEGIMLPGLVLLLDLLHRNFKRAVYILIAMAAGGFFVGITNFLTTGLWLPTTFYAKHGQPSLDYLDTVLLSFRQDIGLLFYVPVFGLTIIALRWSRERKPLLALIALYSVLAPLGMAIGSGSYEPLDRYTLFLLPLWILLFMQFVNWLTDLIPDQGWKEKAIAPVLLVGLIVLGFFMLPKWQERHIGATGDIANQQLAYGQWIKDNIEPDRRIAASDIGAVAWISGNYIVDLRGLIQPQYLNTTDYPLTSIASDSLTAEIIKKSNAEWAVLPRSSFPFITGYNPGARIVHKVAPRNTYKCATAFVIMEITDPKVITDFDGIAPQELSNNPDMDRFMASLEGGDPQQALKGRKVTIGSMIYNIMSKQPPQNARQFADYILAKAPDDTLTAFMAFAYKDIGQSQWGKDILAQSPQTPIITETMATLFGEDDGEEK